ncbi:hypothetical protein L218DRAFT_1076047 [Marasmius fiardii PR-910]|nr:hypothetical protein L218DRAFT_1076047 [Marasmius fiardii PR-910]
MPIAKRRKLSSSSKSAGCRFTTTVNDITPPSLSTTNVATRVSLKASSPFLCPICNSPSCAICSRTCRGLSSIGSRVTTTSPWPSSISPAHPIPEPPLPDLTWSPSPTYTSPTSTPSPPLAARSPKRFALALNAGNTNLISISNSNTILNATSNTTGKRKTRVESEEAVNDGDIQAENETGVGKGSGCGRVVCKNCCYEDTICTICIECLPRA